MLPILGRAFRPFFLLAALSGFFSIALWSALLFWGAHLDALVPTSGWHGHELIFGFGGAALWGFVLTACPVWTKTQPVIGWRLVILALCFLANRGVAFVPGENSRNILVGLGLCGWALVFFWVSRPILQKQSRRNYGIPWIIALIGGLEILHHLGGGPRSLQVAIGAFVVLIVIIGGRITPLFTKNALKRVGIEGVIRHRSWLDDLAVWSAALALAVEIFSSLPAFVVGAVTLFSGLAQLARMKGWAAFSTFKMPILWILHLAYLATGLGLLLRGMHLLWPAMIPWSSALHAQAMGGMGLFILAMMSRVSLGHTGRPLKVHAIMVFAYIAMALGALLRILAPAMQGQAAQIGLMAAAGALGLALALFFLVYTPPLFNVRPDGKSG
jgi:uncharacterized protein involved in response to NO